jgi:tRNA(Leu) C34 or U34 (ribose-2'-O)-methylase TrmL
VNDDQRGFAAIGLYRPKDTNNMGCVMRAAGCYGAAMVAIQGPRFGNSKTDTQKAWKHIPTIQTDELLGVIPFGAVPVAIEILPFARPLTGYVHPERAFYIFGPEDGSISLDIVSRCRDVVYVPTNYCMNLAATVNVVLYDRMLKRTAQRRVA